MSKLIELEPNDKVLISRTDKLGDLVLALPFVETFKARYPENKIDVMASLYASPILENNKNIHKILRVQNDQLLINNMYRKDLLQKIKKEKYKAVIVLFPERQISRLYYKAEIPVRIGTAGRFHSIFFNTRLLHSRKKNVKHEFQYNLDFMSFFQKGKTIKEPKVYLTPKDIESAKRILSRTGVDRDFIVLHPGSGGSAESWSFDKFMDLYNILQKKGIVLVVSGSEKEGELLDGISHKVNMDLNKITGSTDLRALAAVLSLSKVVVANSTGPLHLAVAVGTPTVGLYPSKKSMSPVRWGPIGKNNIVFQPEGVECECIPGQCTCMEKIEASAVADEVMRIFNS
ncbi:MAG: lipopolysaccharide heptosyltransferase family protein [Calditrichaeota bacterium]|nr:MAG: lipopolysaccharide heptosyltransferase family protein [Calditrichota bacterium]